MNLSPMAAVIIPLSLPLLLLLWACLPTREEREHLTPRTVTMLRERASQRPSRGWVPIPNGVPQTTDWTEVGCE